jgi:peptide/nickel transport system ATP-binding protein
VWSSQVDLAILDSDEYSRQGCRYAGRCPFVMDVCRTTVPPNYEVEGRTVKCFLYDSAVDKTPAAALAPAQPA